MITDDRQCVIENLGNFKLIVFENILQCLCLRSPPECWNGGILRKKMKTSILNEIGFLKTIMPI